MFRNGHADEDAANNRVEEEEAVQEVYLPWN